MRRRLHHEPRRDATGRILITRAAAAHLGHRDIDHVRKTVAPVAYDVIAHWRHPASPLCQACAATAAALLDLDDVEELLGGRAHRNATRSRLAPVDT